jgi:hypothetical protein
MESGSKHNDESKNKIRFALLENNNSVKYDLNYAIDLFTRALELSEDNRFTFIGTLAKHMGTNRNHMWYLANTKFPIELEQISHQLMCNIESNCFEQANNGNIKYQMAILALKSFHSNWTEKIQTDNTNTTNVNFNIKDILGFDEPEE